jgi:SAM-dependent methyltransferase
MTRPVTTAAGNADMAAAWDGSEGDHWSDHAGHYESSAAGFGQALLDAVAVDDRSAVLDVGCGTGATTLACGRIARAGAVLGVDLSSRMLDRARAAAADEGLEHVRFEQADAQVFPFDAAAFDVAVSSFGAMFFADPVAAFSNIRRALRPRASMTLMAWRDLGRNEWVMAFRDALAAGRDLPTPPPGAQGPFSLADRDITTERLTAAGFADVGFASLDETMYFGRDVDDAWPPPTSTRRLGTTRSRSCAPRSTPTRPATASGSPPQPG